MSGFFDLPNVKPEAKTIKGAVGCDACNLKHNVKSPNIPPTGQGKLSTFVLGEAPGEQEDRLNNQFVGETGHFLRKCLRALGYDLDRDFRKSNVLSCRPMTDKGSNRTPTSREIKACAPNWRLAIKQFQPKNIILFGGKAVEAYFMNRTQPITENLSITRWRKLCVPDNETNAWVFPMYHPSFPIRNPDAEYVFKLDLKWIMEQIDYRLKENIVPEFPDYSSKVTSITNFDELIGLLRNIKERKCTIAFDYETSGLRPYYPGHNIWTMSLSVYGEDHAYAWPYSYPGAWSSEQLASIKKMWGEILVDQEILKVAQNIQMERPWSKLIVGVDPQGWYWDTMVASHIEDERPKFTGLDFQVFIRYGYEYGEEVAQYKRAAPGSKFNTMHKCPLPELLKYNGLDSYFTMNVAMSQWDQFGDVDRNRSYELFHKGITTFSDMEMEGINVDVNYYQDTSAKLDKRLAFIEKHLLRSPEALLFKAKEGKDINLASPIDLKKLLFTHLNLPSVKKTVLDNDSVDKDVMESIDLQFTRDLVKKRKLSKLKSTYLDGILNLQVAGKLHPNFNLHLVRTYRSSSSDPNFQNLPQRDKESMTMVRGGIIPRKGGQLIEADFGGHEIGVIACYSKDPVLLEERRQELDIHKEWADFLQVSRFDGKNGFTFALFYGSYFKNIHTDLYNRGYHDLPMMRVRQAEREFWKKYRGVKKFQEKQVEFYKNNGYVEMFHGFKRGGFLTKNEIVNTPIQGTAFHLLLWACWKLNEISKEEGWKARLIGQIHDSLLIDSPAEETSHVVEVTKRVMTEDILEPHPWIVIPMIADISVTGIDEPWYLKKDYTDK